MKKNDLSVFEMEKDGFKLKLQKGAGDQTVFSTPVQAIAPMPLPLATIAGGGGQGNATASQSQTETSAPAAAAKDESLRDITSPMVGTFYRANSPDAPAFVDVGKAVSE